MKKENGLAALLSILLYMCGFAIIAGTALKLMTPEGGDVPFLLIPSLVGGFSLLAFGCMLRLLSHIEMHLRDPEPENNEEEEEPEEAK